jgi:hypothetical protein
MVNQKKALDRLREEKDYEDNLINNLNLYFLQSIDTIEGLSKKEKEVLKKGLLHIRNESVVHEQIIARLFDMVMENGEDKY